MRFVVLMIGTDASYDGRKLDPRCNIDMEKMSVAYFSDINLGVGLWTGSVGLWFCVSVGFGVGLRCRSSGC